jgi:hypothetical protein
VVVAAGPTLDDALSALRDIADRVVIVACDTAVPALLGAGIDPDIIATIDLNPRKTAILRRTADRTRAVLAQLQYAPPAADRRLDRPPALARRTKRPRRTCCRRSRRSPRR